VQKKLLVKCWWNWHSVVNFINILPKDPKSTKRYWQLDWIFMLLGSAPKKGARKTLVKLSPEQRPRRRMRWVLLDQVVRSGSGPGVRSVADKMESVRQCTLQGYCWCCCMGELATPCQVILSVMWGLRKRWKESIISVRMKCNYVFVNYFKYLNKFLFFLQNFFNRWRSFM